MCPLGDVSEHSIAPSGDECRQLAYARQSGHFHISYLYSLLADFVTGKKAFEINA